MALIRWWPTPSIVLVDVRQNLDDIVALGIAAPGRWIVLERHERHTEGAFSVRVGTPHNEHGRTHNRKGQERSHVHKKEQNVDRQKRGHGSYKNSCDDG